MGGRTAKRLAAGVALSASLSASAASEETVAEVAASSGVAFGAAIAARDTLRRPELILRYFTSVTAENAHKWSRIEREEGRRGHSAGDAVVAMAEAHGLRTRGHTLVWGRGNGAPKWLRERFSGPGASAEELRRLTAAHIEDVVGRYRGRVAQWDVVNEPLAMTGVALDPLSPFGRLLGEDGFVQAFKAAAAADPRALLFINEFGLEADPRRFDAFLALVDRLIAAGAPIDGVGLQGHFLRAPPDRARLETMMRAIEERRLIVEITELDIPLRLFKERPDPDAAQAAAFGDVASACLAVSACAGITVWGLLENESWLGPTSRALPLDRRGRPRPAMDAIAAALAKGRPGP
ncbi:MAG: endo-1,4-beta-xylanase [Pseudomonadota bacterium]